MSIEFLLNDLDKVNYLSNLLTSSATGGDADNSEFVQLRHELLKNPILAPMLPGWLKLHRDLASFWGFIKNKRGTYAERRTYLSEEFASVCNFLEFGEQPAVRLEPVKQISSVQPSPLKAIVEPKKNKVFIVHGRDNEAKQEAARHIESIGLEAIILHEQASSGMTIIEKIEHYAGEADFAIVIYTPCDKGRGAFETTVPARDRARQNVVFEHGYLMAKLGRKNVCALVKGQIETPNDISGVVYVSMDQAGAWKNDVNLELKACGYSL